MKKKIIAIALAILTGVILSFPVFKNQQKEIKPLEPITMYVLQTGVYNNYENALKEQQKVEGSVIYQDGSYYRVLVGASKKESGLEKIENLLKEAGIHYYKKEISFFESKESFEDYNLMLEKVETKETILLLNKKILEQMEGL